MSKTRFSVVVDSTFRVQGQYPDPTSFVIPVHYSAVNDYVNTPVFVFAWTSTLRILNGTISGGSQSSLILSDNLKRSIRNYYVGCLANLYNGGTLLESSMIVGYDPSDNTVDLEVGFTNRVQENIDLTISLPDTTTNPYILQIQGYFPDFIFEYTSLYLYSFKKKWIRPIRFISQYGLINLSEPLPLDAYEINDIFQIRTSSQILQYPLVSFFKSIEKWSIRTQSHHYVVGSKVFVEPDLMSGTTQIFRVYDVMPSGEPVLEVLQYGGPFGQSTEYVLYDMSQLSVPVETLSRMSVLTTRTVVDAGTKPIPSPENNVLYFGTQLYQQFLYYTYVVKDHYIIINDEKDSFSDLVTVLESPSEDDRQYGFLSKQKVQCAMNVANFSLPDNNICMSVKLEYLILPNRRVRGYNKLLSFFPYVIVRFYNVDSSQYSRYGTVTSNNPTTANCQFICPIGNLLNPTIIKFVEVSSDASQVLKLNPAHDMRFEVVLPDGDILQYEPEFSNLGEALLSSSFSIRNTVACIFSFVSL